MSSQRCPIYFTKDQNPPETVQRYSWTGDTDPGTVVGSLADNGLGIGVVYLYITYRKVSFGPAGTLTTLLEIKVGLAKSPSQDGEVAVNIICPGNATFTHVPLS